MIYLMQILKMMTAKQRQNFVALFDDLSYEIQDMGYEGFETQLVNEMLDDHFGIFLEDDSQLKMLTDYILKHQNNLGGSVKGICLYMGL